MMETKLYLYDSSQEANQYRGKDYSSYMLLGDSNNDPLNEELEVVNLTLVGLKEGKEFTPTTMFILEKWNTTNGVRSLYKDWHLVVTNDVVSQPIISDNNYFQHSITLMELGVIAQQRIVDNISVTYKLKDVTLNEELTFDPTQKVGLNLVNNTPSNLNGEVFSLNTGWSASRNAVSILGKQYIWEISAQDKQKWENVLYNTQIPVNAETIKFSLPVPKLKIMNGKIGTNGYEYQGYCSVRSVVEETNNLTNEVAEVVNMVTNPTESWVEEKTKYWTETAQGGYYTDVPIGKGNIINEINYTTGAFAKGATTLIKKVAEIVNVEDPNTKNIEFEVKPNCRYTIRCTLNNFENTQDLAYQYGWSQNLAITYARTRQKGGVFNVTQEKTIIRVNNQTPSFGININVYKEKELKKIMYRPAPPVSAYELFQKCQIASQQVEKVNGISILDTPQTFYLDDEDVERLKNTTIVENFYNQKNLWEMFIEIGKYIHSIPYIRFGKDNRFVVKWKQLGDTQQQVDSANKITIFNSRSIENYICAVSSYVSNAVQLGGVIDEWVAPKSSSEDFLVSNDNVKIITSKPIIEIVDMEVKQISSGEVRNLVGKGTHNEDPNGFVFERSVYNTFGIEHSILPNKGLSMYYELGTNIVDGLTYRLPTVNTGDPLNDYSIKKIIKIVFGLTESKNVKVNDYLFHIIYRTKDDLRSNQSRPDLRKYLLNSKYDTIPQHNQFNNQQDVLVDSNKFGNNVYGKLIRTGNTEYRVTEWCSSLFDIKESGQLVNIFGNLYYVAKVENTYFADHIISEVTYSKDYNQLSEIIGIPSEPRFYEISERSIIDREVAFNEYISIGTTQNKIVTQRNSKINSFGWAWIRGILFGKQKESKYPKYAITTFKNDINRQYGSVVANELFYKDICTPVNVYAMHNTLSIEWDMLDNFTAGDKVLEKDYPRTPIDSAYKSLMPVSYVDAFGRADLVDVVILKDIPQLTAEEIRDFPESPYNSYHYYKSDIYGGPLDKAPTVIDDTLKARILTEIKESLTWPENGDIYCVYFSVKGGPRDKFYYFKCNYYTTPNEHVDVSVSKRIVIDNYGDILLQTRKLKEMDNKHGIGLLMDNREVFRGNYNIQAVTDSDRFVFSSYMWKPKEYVKFAFLNTEVNKISFETIPSEYIIKTAEIYWSGTDLYESSIDGKYISFNSYTTGKGTTCNIQINVDTLIDESGIDINKIKALAFIDTKPVNGIIESGSTYLVFAKNVTDLGANKRDKWYIQDIDMSIFSKENGNYQ